LRNTAALCSLQPGNLRTSNPEHPAESSWLDRGGEIFFAFGSEWKKVLSQSLSN
jgi:hypothetical protein